MPAALRPAPPPAAPMPAPAPAVPQAAPAAAGLTIGTERGPLLVPADALTFAGFRRWAVSDDSPEFGRFSFLGDRLEIDVTQESLESHNVVKTEVTSVLHTSVKARDLGKVYADGVPVVVEAVSLRCNPDMVFVSHAGFESGRVTWTPKANRPREGVELVGPPDLVVEVVSDASVHKDTRDLFDLYFAAGVAEYWLIDARGEAVDFRLLTRGDSGWTDAAPDADGFRRSPVLGRRYRLDRVPRRGGVGYDLSERDPAAP